MDYNTGIQDQEQAEEALSLSGFPITTDQADCDGLSKYRDRRSSSEPCEFFEFFNDLGSEMSYAEEIIFCGKLIAFKEQSLSNQTHDTTTATTTTTTTTTTNRDDKLKSFHRRRSESLSELKSSQTNGAKTRFMSNSRSFDYRKLRRTLSTNSEASEIRRNSSVRSSGRSENGGQKVSKRRWYVFIFGLVKFPPTMELKDMKNRQARRNPSTMFPPFDGGRDFPVNRSQRKDSWGLLKVLSCKGHASVAVTASFGCMSQV